MMVAIVAAAGLLAAVSYRRERRKGLYRALDSRLYSAGHAPGG
jgi:hypothetical protein